MLSASERVLLQPNLDTQILIKGKLGLFKPELYVYILECVNES